MVWGGRFSHPGDAPMHVQNPLDLELNVTKNVSEEEVRRLRGEAGRAAQLLCEGRWWQLLFADGMPQPQVKPISVRHLFEKEEEGVDGAKVAKVQPANPVNLANLLGGAAAGQSGAGKAAARRRNGSKSEAFSGLRLTVDGERPGADRSTGSPAVTAAAAARQRRAAEAAAAENERRTATEAMALLDATANKRPAKRKKKKKRSQAGS